jgi:zinc transporter 1/2/3
VIQVREAGKPKPKWVEKMTPFILLIGLGTHALFEGLALGLEQDASKVEILALAIILHKGAAGMSLGISMFKTFPGDNEKRFVLLMLTLFALFTPIGVILGMILQGSSEMTEIVFSCFAAGSFLYIACSEVIVEEFSISNYRFTKLFFFVIGIIMISSLHFLG